MIKCQVCGRNMKVVSNTHLKTHGLTMEEYGNLFPGSPMHSEEYRSSCSRAHKGVRFPKWEEKYDTKELKRKRQIARKDMIRRISDGTIPHTMTKPHRILSKALSESFSGLAFECEFTEKYYSIDIACSERRLAIEVDGDFFHNKGALPHSELSPIQRRNASRDRGKDKFLKRRGWKVARFWESKILEDIESVIEEVSVLLESEPPEPFDYDQLFDTPRRCDLCGAPLGAKQVIAGYRHCSRECGYRARRKKIVSSCRECGERIVSHKKRSFCGTKCQKIFEARDAKRRIRKATPKIRNSSYHKGLREKGRIHLVCPCGKPFWKHRSHISKKYRDCCSVKCANKFKILKGSEHEA